MILPIFYDVDISQPLVPTPMQQMLITEDAYANRIGIRLYNGKEPYSPGGTCAGFAVNRAGQTIPITGGAVNGNEMYIDLPPAAYALAGPINIGIKNVSGSTETTLFLGLGTVIRGETGTAIDPGTIIPSVSALIAAIEAAVATIPADYSDINNAVKALTHIELTESGYIGADGEELGNSNYRRTGFIACASAATVSITGFWTGTGAYAYTFYDANKTRISGANSVVGSASPEVPSGTAYVRFSSRVSEGETPAAYVANYAVADIAALKSLAENAVYYSKDESASRTAAEKAIARGNIGAAAVTISNHTLVIS